REYGLDYQRNQVLVSCGGKHSLYNLLQALVNPGDEVLIPSPYWVSYSDMTLLAGGIPKIVPTNEESGFRLSPEQLADSLSSKTRVFILNSPSNPTGAAYDRADLEALSRVLERHDCLIISDDIYEKIVYDDFRFYSIATINPKLRERIILVNSVSKTYAMTGWRIGYALGPVDVIAAAGNIQSQSTSNPTSIAQAAALEAIQGPQDDVQVMVQEFQKRRDLIFRRLSGVPGFRCFHPQGAFYLFPNVGALLGKTAKGKRLGSANDLAQYFLEEARVLAVPGEDFGSSENIRFTYATSLQEIAKGCDRIEAAVKKLI
ncbi:MAG: pyridoxal phosphate-dependent aminotransferase, partial [Candidatus Binatia bacterium]